MYKTPVLILQTRGAKREVLFLLSATYSVVPVLSCPKLSSRGKTSCFRNCRLYLGHLPGDLDNNLEPLSTTSSEEGTDSASVWSLLGHRSLALLLTLAHLRHLPL